MPSNALASLKMVTILFFLKISMQASNVLYLRQAFWLRNGKTGDLNGE
jgi:hypothetical protein